MEFMDKSLKKNCLKFTDGKFDHVWRVRLYKAPDKVSKKFTILMKTYPGFYNKTARQMEKDFSDSLGEIGDAYVASDIEFFHVQDAKLTYIDSMPCLDETGQEMFYVTFLFESYTCGQID